jgi:hypothetical protein
MRKFGVTVALLSMMGVAMPAHAAALKYCNDIKDDQGRMACLQDHISHLEEVIVSLDGQVAQLGKDLDQKLSANAVYKLQSVAQGLCLGFAGENQPPIVFTCDHPDSWKLLAGAQTKNKPDKPAEPASNPLPSSLNSATPPPAALTSTSEPKSTAPNPCRGLDQVACAAKPAECEWMADKNTCGTVGKSKTPRASTSHAPSTP